MEVNTGADQRKITMFVPDIDVAHKAENNTMNAVCVHDEGDLEYIKELIAKYTMTRAMEDDAAANVPTYLPTGEVANAVHAVRA